MKKNHIFLAIIFVFTVFVTSCDLNSDSTSTDQTDTLGTVTLTGSIVEAATGNGIASATIRISDGSTVKGATSNSEGVFTTTLEFADDIDLSIIAAKDGYLSDTTNVFAILGATALLAIGGIYFSFINPSF